MNIWYLPLSPTNIQSFDKWDLVDNEGHEQLEPVLMLDIVFSNENRYLSMKIYVFFYKWSKSGFTKKRGQSLVCRYTIKWYTIEFETLRSRSKIVVSLKLFFQHKPLCSCHVSPSTLFLKRGSATCLLRSRCRFQSNLLSHRVAPLFLLKRKKNNCFW